MDDLRKTRDRGARLGDLADQAEYDTLVKRYREEEQRNNMKNLLYGSDSLPPKDQQPE